MILPRIKFPRPGPRPRVAGLYSWNLADLTKAYEWPSGLAGYGVIGVIELGGGWRESDVRAFAALNDIPTPVILDISVDGTQNAFGADADADGEVALDIQVCAAAYSLATGHAATIRVYWVKDIAMGINRAAADGCDVCSISWGMDEANWPPAAALALETAAASAVTAGMAIFAAAGDNDSSDGGPTPANVDLPAGCPHVIGCGGTRLLHGGAGETVWNNSPGNTDGSGTGGGFSSLFPEAPWQLGAPIGRGKMVPDVAANADPDTGYEIVVGDQKQAVGGTSAVAPLFAGLFAAFGKNLGWIAPRLWAAPHAFNDVLSGDNGEYHAGAGPDPCTGLGSPKGRALAGVFVK